MTPHLGIERLAVQGGNPVSSKPFSPWPEFDEQDIAAVSQTLRSGKVNYWTGEQCRLFEREFAEFVGTKYAIALSNGTVALELALRAVGVGPGDDVIVPARTFIATASAVVAVGGRPIVADIDAISGNLTSDTIAACLTSQTKAVIPVHVGGLPCDMRSIMQLAKAKNLRVIEDCAQAHGARIDKQPVGSFGDLAAFSFCQDKIMTTGGEGGAITTNDPQLWERAWSYKDHGKSFSKVSTPSQNNGFRWLHDSFGTNFRMSEMQAAVGRSVLKRLEQWVNKRQANAQRLDRQFEGISGILRQQTPVSDRNAYYRYYVFLTDLVFRAGWTRDQITSAIQAEGVPCGSGSCCEIYREKAFATIHLEPSPKSLPIAQEFSKRSIALLVHPSLTSEEMQVTSQAVKKVIRHALSNSNTGSIAA